MNKVSRHRALTVSLLAALLLCLASIGLAQGEKKLSAKQLPSAIRASFHKSYPAAKIIGASSEVENGKTLYEVESVDRKTNRDLLYTEDGTCVEIEETVPLNALPDEVSKALKKEAGKGKVQKAERLTKGGAVQYEFMISSGKDKREVIMDPSGKTVKVTKMKAKEKEEEEKD